MTTTYVKHPVTGGAAEVARLVLTDKNGTPKEVSALWKDGVCLFAKKGALVKNGNEMEDIDGNDVMAWSLPSDTPIPRHTYPWESEIIPLHDEDRWYVIVPNSVVVTMGGVDITDTCYDAETHKISIPMVKGDIVVEAEATEVIQFEQFQKEFSRVVLNENPINGGNVETGTAKIVSIEGNTFVWNQLFENASSVVTPVVTDTYLLQINGARSIVTVDENTQPFVAQTATDMCINLSHLYGCNKSELAFTQAQFEALFPLDYYPYSAPRLIHMGLTKCESLFGSDVVDTVNFNVSQITGKLNGEGNSVTIFPNGMAGTFYYDEIYKDEDGWKAVIRCHRGTLSTVGKTPTLVNGKYYFSLSTSASYDGMSNAARNMIVCDAYTSDKGDNAATLPLKHTCCSRASHNTRLWISEEEYQSGVPDNIHYAYALLESLYKTYVLDDEWQAILDATFQVQKGGTEKVYPINGVEPTSAPVVFTIEYPVIDYAVKQLCIENFAKGNNNSPIVAGEFTAKEAAAVTSLNDVFYENQDIQKFNEFKYFINVSGLYSRSMSGYPNGQFYYCRNLQNITLPSSGVLYYLNGAFKNCFNLKIMDFTPITIETDIKMGDTLRCTSVASSLKKIILPSMTVESFYNFVNRRTGLKEIEIRGTLTFLDNTLFSSSFYQCNSLTTITGRIENIANSISFSYSPLSVESALVILNGLSDEGNEKTVTFKASMQETYEADSDFNTAVETAIANGWEIVYS